MSLIPCTIIIFFGIAKHAFKTWKDLGILTTSDYEIIQSKVDLMNPPPKLGRIVRKINSGFASFTANEWKNWILIYSLHGLHGILSREHYHCWCIFVEACRTILLPVVTDTQVKRAHDLLIFNFNEFLRLYGSKYCSPNMHMACHLRECMLDYGPLSTFWCFAFEHYNGTLEEIQTSWYRPEKQMLVKFLDKQHLSNLGASLVNTSEKDKDLVALMCENEIFKQQIQCILDVSMQQEFIITKQLQNYYCRVSMIDAEAKEYQCLTSPVKEKCFTDVELSYLQKMYSFVYPASKFEHISRFYYQSKCVLINNVRIHLN